MDQKNEVQVELIETSAFNNAGNNQNPEIQSNKGCSRLKLIIIISSILVVVIAFIFILLFAILKVDEDDKKEKEEPEVKGGEEEDNRIPIIMDVDEGGDDMIAYIVANNSKKYNILGITTMSCYHYVDEVGKIWLRFLEHMNFDNKVYLGENHSLVKQTDPVPFNHNYGFDLPQTNKTLEEKGAVDFMYETIKNYKKKVTIFALGPLTNIAKLIQKDNTIINNIQEIIIMGGAKTEGNAGLDNRSEWNIYSDAEAANIVFNCGIQIKAYGQEIKMDFNDTFYQKLIDINTKSSIFTYNAAKGTFETWNDNWVYDPITLLNHLHNDIVELIDYYSEVNTDPPNETDSEYGIMNFLEPNETLKANIKYAENFNVDICYKHFEYYLRMY